MWLPTGDRRPWTVQLLLAAACGAAVAMTIPAGPGAMAEGPDKWSLQSYDKVEPQKYPWGWIRWLMNSQIDPQAEMTLGIVHIEPNQANPAHIHPNSAEYLHVLSGACEHRLGDRWIALKTGDTLRIPKGVVHSARTADQPCRVMVVYDTGTRQMTPVNEGQKKPPAP